MQQYARFYQAHCLEIETRAREAVERSPDWARVFEQLGGSQLWSPASDELMMQAIFEGRWEPFLATLRAQGEHFARAGATYSAWFEVFRAYRNCVKELLATATESAQRNPQDALIISRGMQTLLDIAIEQIGEAYLDAKQRERVRAEQALSKMEHQLRHAQKMEVIGRLADGVAHDFNNVLTIVQTHASILEEAIDDRDGLREDVAAIRRAATRGSELTRQLLALSRKSDAEPRPVDVPALIKAFMPMLRRLLGETVTLTTSFASVPELVIDPGAIEQMLMHLALRAKDAMPDSGRVTIECRSVDLDRETAGQDGLEPGPFVEIAVTDTGAGGDVELARSIDPEPEHKQLGLAAVQSLVAQARGRLTMYSERGHGTTVRVQLPVAETGRPSGHFEIPAALPALRTLIVDDDSDVRAAAARILRDAGCYVIEAGSAADARKICVRHEDPIDLVLLDVMLSDGRGDLLAYELRELRPTITVVLMSGYAVSALGTTGIRPDQVLHKPFSPSELRAAIARACATGRSSSSEAPTREGARYRALVADDDGTLRRVFGRMLAKADFEVVDVDSGQRAIEVLAAQSFDVIISDVQMPDGSGIDLLRAIRRVDLDVPVILMTGEPSVEAAAAAVEYGAFRYLTKPLESTGFVMTVKQAARAHALARIRREAYHVTGAHAGTTDRAGLEVRFEQALQGLWLAFQPIVHASTGALFGVEALMRVSEPSLPNPGAMLDAATQLGRVSLVGRKVRSLASAALAGRADKLALFVNLHPDDLHDSELVDESSPLAKIASQVVLEVTERTSLESSPKLSERLARLRQLGFRLAVDDIGAGFSGLTSFTELMPEVVKIDMSLVRDVHKSAVKQRTIAALCRLCHDSGTLVVGEGVETPEERDMLVSLGCDLLQGYLIARPQRELP